MSFTRAPVVSKLQALRRAVAAVLGVARAYIKIAKVHYRCHSPCKIARAH